MSFFQYHRISFALLDQLQDLVRRGESVVLLGPRHIGKDYVLNELLGRLNKIGYQNLSAVLFRQAVPDDELRVQGPPLTWPSQVAILDPTPEAVFAWVDDALARTTQRVVLMASHIDSLPDHVIKDFLKQLRVRVQGSESEPGRLAAVLVGEADLRQLVSGPTSEFNCTHEFVLQGFDEDLFGELVERYADALCLKIAEPRGEQIRELHRLAGGSTYLLRLLLGAVLDRWAVAGAPPGRVLACASIPVELVASQMHLNHHLRYVTRLVENDPESWGMLERLLGGEPVSAPYNHPELLELVGMAVRGEDGTLRLTCDLVEQFLRQYYTPRRFADLYALNDRWQEAFERYGNLKDPDQRIRPRNLDDVVDVEGVVKALCTSLYQEALEGADKVRKRFVDGCHQGLGFSEVTFWRQGRTGWRSIGGLGVEVPRAPLGLYHDILTQPAENGLLAVAPAHERSVAAALLPPRRKTESRREAVIVGNPAEPTILSRARQQCARRLLQHYLAAQEYAWKIDWDRDRLWRRDRHVDIVNAIFAALGTEITDVGQTLRAAAGGLRRLGYSRVLFSLVDPERARILGVLEDSDDSDRTMCRLTKYALTQHSLQTDVLNKKRPIIVQDAAREHRINRAVTDATGLKNAIIVPLLTSRETAIGTLLVERDDGRRHTREEMKDLARFARNLGTAIAQSERVELLQSALNQLQDPVVILDRQFRLRYANEPASRYFKTSARWHPPEDARPIIHLSQVKRGDDVIDKIFPQVRQTIEAGERHVRHLKVTAEGKPLNVALFTTPIEDWQGSRVGALCHSQDMSFLYLMFDAIRLLQGAYDTSNVIRLTVEATKVLGHRWGRLWIVPEDDPARFELETCFDLDGGSLSDTPSPSDCLLPRRDSREGWESWLCLDKREPVVFCHFPDRADLEPVLTEKGLMAVNVRTPLCQGTLEKSKGEYWIDFPLLAGRRAFGKLTLSCHENYRPEHFEFMKVLREMVTNFLETSLSREKDFQNKTLWMEQNAEQVVRDTCHHIATNLAALPALLSRYRQVGGDNPALADLHAQFAKILGSMNKMVGQTRERLLRNVAEKRRADVVAVIRKTFEGFGTPLDWHFEEAPPALEMDLDAPRFESALLELLYNACRSAPASGPLCLAVRLRELRRQDRAWVRVEVADNGPGIPETLKEKIFELFFSHRPQRERGTGVGLFFVRRIVQTHGGIISEQGKEGKGARFVIDLPRFDDSAPVGG